MYIYIHSQQGVCRRKGLHYYAYTIKYLSRNPRWYNGSNATLMEPVTAL